MFCFRCEKPITFWHSKDNPEDAGIVTFSFGYGSGCDQMPGRQCLEGEEQWRKLISCPRITGYICDKCFKDVSKFLSGSEIRKSSEEILLVTPTAK